VEERLRSANAAWAERNFRGTKGDERERQSFSQGAIITMLGELFDPKQQWFVREHFRPHWTQASAVVFIHIQYSDNLAAYEDPKPELQNSHSGISNYVVQTHQHSAPRARTRRNAWLSGTWAPFFLMAAGLPKIETAGGTPFWAGNLHAVWNVTNRFANMGRLLLLRAIPSGAYTEDRGSIEGVPQ